MFRKLLLPILSAAALTLAVYHVYGGYQAPVAMSPDHAGVRQTTGATVAGAGIIEARSQNIAIGSPLPGLVAEVFVQVGQKVQAGDELFRLDDRHQQAELRVREAALASAQSQLARLESLPRPEELPIYEAKIGEAEANLTEQEDALHRTRDLIVRRIVPEQELVRREQAFLVAREQLARAKAEHHLIKSGPPAADKAVARATVEQARAQVAQVQTDLERSRVRASVDGEVLQVNIRPGEYVGTPPNQPLVVLGNLERLHVRVDIDDHDIPRLRSGSPAKAILRGNPSQEFTLTFVRIDPYVIPKKSLTGDNTERVDTRVLQMVYALETQAQGVYVGQQMDVFLDVRE
jgi:multidrug resistance efflux pump